MRIPDHIPHKARTKAEKAAVAAAKEAWSRDGYWVSDNVSKSTLDGKIRVWAYPDYRPPAVIEP